MTDLIFIYKINERKNMATKQILLKKAKDSQVIYDDLVRKFKIDDLYPTTFIADENVEKILKKNYLAQNPFPFIVKPVLAKLRKKLSTNCFCPKKFYKLQLLLLF